MKTALWIITMMFLLHCSYSDLRCNMISLWACLAAGGMAIALRILSAQSLRVCLGGMFPDMLPGALLMGVAIGSGEQIGKGDAWMLTAVGLLNGAAACVRTGIAALVISLFHALLLCAACGKESCKKIAFAPDLLIAYLMLTVVGWQYS